MTNPQELITQNLNKANSDSFDIKPKKVEAWIKSLPMANLGETSRLIYNALVETNKTRYNYQDRTRFLEILQEHLHYITEGMRKHFIGVGFPLPEKSKKVATATRKIYTEIATAYKISLENILSSHSLFSDNRLLTLILHRTITSLSRELLTSYQTYAPYRKNIWFEIHKIFTIAKDKKCHRTTVNNADQEILKKTSISDEYKRILLVSLSSPYCLRHGEINKIYAALDQWTDLIDIFEFTKKDSSKGVFAVDTKSDLPPRYLTINPTDFNTSTVFLISTEQLTNKLRHEIRYSDDVTSTTLIGLDMQHPDLSHDLLRKLLNYWGHIPKRAFPRSAKNEKISVAMGLNSAHRIIFEAATGKNSNKNRKNEFNEPANFESITVLENSKSKNDVWNMVYPASDKTNNIIEFESATKTTISDKQLEKHYSTENWEIVNESAGGYCISCSNGCASKVQVGELIGIRRSGDGHTWKWGVGTVRWMRFCKDNILLLGIQMITPDAAAVGLRTSAEDDVNENYHRTLMLPKLQTINQPATLITPPVPYRVGSKVEIKIVGIKIKVELTKQLVNTGLFAQFQFTPVKDEKSTQSDIQDSTTDNMTDSDCEIQSVWTSI
ncbi:MAG: hypothetical protein ACC657_14520 [Thiohalomonadales bacterium]